MRYAEAHCARLPVGMAQQVNAVLAAAAQADEHVLAQTNALVDGLDRLLLQERLIAGEP